jgi:cytosine deaminase
VIDLLLRNAHIEGETCLLDVAVDNGVIIDRGPHLDSISRQEINVGGCLIIPGFVESHIHLDIALMNSWVRPGRLEPYQSSLRSNELVEDLRSAFTREDIEHRAGMALEMASRHGVTAMRAQCHVDTEVGTKHLEALLNVREKYAGRVTVQIVAFPQKGLLGDPRAKDVLREAFRIGADVMGGAGNLDRDAEGNLDPEGHIDTALDLAMEMDVGLDIHVDHELPQTAELDDLEVVYLARQVIERGYQGRVVVGHAAALDSATPNVVEEAIEIMREADLSVVTVPDLIRLGREDARHVRRGLPPVKRLLEAGVNVVYASNNVRDIWRSLGNFDLLEEALVLAYGAHMDTVEELNSLLHMSTRNAARALQLEGYGLQKGCNADLVILDAPSASAAVVGQAEKRYVFKAGRLMTSSKVVSELINGVKGQAHLGAGLPLGGEVRQGPASGRSE